MDNEKTVKRKILMSKITGVLSDVLKVGISIIWLLGCIVLVGTMGRSGWHEIFYVIGCIAVVFGLFYAGYKLLDWIFSKF